MLDQVDALGDEMRQVWVQTPGFLIGGNRVCKPLLSRIVHPQMDVNRRLVWIECQHLLETPNGFVILLLVPGNVAELTEAFDVAGMALQRCQGLLLMHRANTQGKFNAVVLWVELEGFAVLAGTLLLLAPPVGQVATEDVT